MQFRGTPLAGAFLVDIEPHADVRGFFARSWCSREFAQHGLPAQIVQTSISHNVRRGTIRGMHMQLPPSREGKLVSCLQGAIYDVIIDLRPQSSSYLRHFGVELHAQAHSALFIPDGVAHGFQTLVDGTEVLYLMTDYFAPELVFGVRWNDPAFAIQWPADRNIVILPRDGEYSDFDRLGYERRLRAAHAGLASGRL